MKRRLSTVLPAIDLVDAAHGCGNRLSIQALRGDDPGGWRWLTIH